MIERYAARAPDLSMADRASYVRRIWATYRQSFQATFMDRPRGRPVSERRSTSEQWDPGSMIYPIDRSTGCAAPKVP